MSRSDSPDTIPADLRVDTRVERVRASAGDGRPALYRCDLSDQWSASYYPFGGTVAAVALRAMEAEVGNSEHRPRTMTTFFSSPVKEGPVEIEVAVLRSGRGMSQLTATVKNAGSEEAGHTSVGVFGAAREGFSFTDVEPPDAPQPEHCDPPRQAPPEYRQLMAGATFFEQLEVKQWNLHGAWESDWVGERAEASRWMRFRVPPRRPDGTLEPAAYVALCDTMPPALGQKLGPGLRPFLAPSCDLTVHFLEPTRDEWLLVQARCHRAVDGYASCTVHLWDRDFRLVAHAAQMMYLRLDPTKPS